jgi:hypothetical protein
MNPLMGLALAHPEQSPLHHLEGVRFQVHQDKQQPIFWHRQRTVLVGRVPPGGARLPIEAPCGHVGLECSLKGQDQPLKLVDGETGQIQHLCGTGLDVGEP